MLKFSAALASFAVAVNAWGNDRYESDSYGLGYDSGFGGYGRQSFDESYGAPTCKLLQEGHFLQNLII